MEPEKQSDEQITVRIEENQDEETVPALLVYNSGYYRAIKDAVFIVALTMVCTVVISDIIKRYE